MVKVLADFEKVFRLACNSPPNKNSGIDDKPFLGIGKTVTITTRLPNEEGNADIKTFTVSKRSLEDFKKRNLALLNKQGIFIDKNIHDITAEEVLDKMNDVVRLMERISFNESDDDDIVEITTKTKEKPYYIAEDLEDKLSQDVHALPAEEQEKDYANPARLKVNIKTLEAVPENLKKEHKESLKEIHRLLDEIYEPNKNDPKKILLQHYFIGFLNASFIKIYNVVSENKNPLPTIQQIHTSFKYQGFNKYFPSKVVENADLLFEPAKKFFQKFRIDQTDDVNIEDVKNFMNNFSK